MHRKIRTVVLCFVLLVCARKGNAQTSDSLNWEASRKLRWADFLGMPDEHTIFGARTFTALRYKLYDNDTGCRVVVRCIFLKMMSWRSDKDTTTYALQHEQGHFDISELYARKLRKAFGEYHYVKRSVHHDVAAIFEQICAEKTAFNNLYDKETIHSLNRVKQQEWIAKIAAVLDSLQEFAQNK